MAGFRLEPEEDRVSRGRTPLEPPFRIRLSSPFKPSNPAIIRIGAHDHIRHGHSRVVEDLSAKDVSRLQRDVRNRGALAQGDPPDLRREPIGLDCQVHDGLPDLGQPTEARPPKLVGFLGTSPPRLGPGLDASEEEPTVRVRRGGDPPITGADDLANTFIRSRLFGSSGSGIKPRPSGPVDRSWATIRPPA
jgi:hypothetical protein